VVRQVATIGDNFFLADYYSLQHLRWGAPTGILPDDENPLPNEIALYQNYPNPFNARTIISYFLPPESSTTISIFDILGRAVRRLEISGTRSQVLWDGLDNSGQHVASGLYFYRIDNHPETCRKMLLLR
jgi:hypothetical protein